MSKLFTLYKQLKNENSETIYLFKSGIFFIALADDAIYLSNHFNLKLTNLNTSVVKCGFPVSSVDKHIKLFSSYGIDFKLINRDLNTIYSPKDFQIDSNIQDLLNTIVSIDIDNLSISEAYNFIDNIKKKASNIYTSYTTKK